MARSADEGLSEEVKHELNLEEWVEQHGCASHNMGTTRTPQGVERTSRGLRGGRTGWHKPR